MLAQFQGDALTDVLRVIGDRVGVFFCFLCNYRVKWLNFWLILSLQLSCAHHFGA